MPKEQSKEKEQRHVAAALAHDLNNYLQVIMGSLELVSRRGEFVPEIVDTALDATRKAANLADRLIAFSRLQPYEGRVVELHTVLEGMLGAMRQVAGEDNKVKTAFAGEVTSARIDPRALRMALAELAANARDAMPGGGTLTLLTAAAPESMVVVEVADTGCGLPKGGPKKEGLGLAIVEWCMRQAGGRFELTSAVGGTRARLFLPAK
jgi:signal transduction histidine kinase